MRLTCNSPWLLKLFTLHLKSFLSPLMSWSRFITSYTWICCKFWVKIAINTVFQVCSLEQFEIGLWSLHVIFQIEVVAWLGLGSKYADTVSAPMLWGWRQDKFTIRVFATTKGNVTKEPQQEAIFGTFKHRSSRPDVFCQNSVLRNFAKFTGKHLRESLCFNKIAGLGNRTSLLL